MPSADPVPALKLYVAKHVAERLAGWNSDDVAALLHTDRRRIADLRAGRLERFSLERLLIFAARLGIQIELKLGR